MLPATREVFMSLDSSRGGGNVLGVNANGLDWSNIAPGKREDGTDCKSPLWTKQEGAFASAVARLDDTVIDPWTTGYHGRPEVLSFATATSFQPCVLGLYNSPGDTGTDQGEIIGETIFYSEPLSAENRSRVTAYLAYKWFGKTLDGYNDVSGAKVEGAGRVVLRSRTAAGLPDLADFAGTFDCLTAALDFGVDANGVVTHGIAVPDGTVDLSDVKTVTVTATTGTFEPGTYVLASGASVRYGEGLAFSLAGVLPEQHRARWLLNGDSLVLVVELKPGLIITVQ